MDERLLLFYSVIFRLQYTLQFNTTFRNHQLLSQSPAKLTMQLYGEQYISKVTFYCFKGLLDESSSTQTTTTWTFTLYMLCCADSLFNLLTFFFKGVNIQI